MTKLKTKVSGLKTPTRNKNEVSTSWKVPAKAKKDDAPDKVRIDGLDMLWVFDAKPENKGRKKKKGDIVERDRTNKDSQKTDTEDFNRKAFHPYKGKPILVNAEFWIRGYNLQERNGRTKRVYGPWRHRALAFKAPDEPTVALSYNSANGSLTPSYSTQHPAKGAKEVHDTQVWVTVGGTKKVNGTAYTDASKTLTAINVSGATTLGIGKFIKCTMSARNRGLGGDSKVVKAKRTLYICCPNAPTCGKPSLVYADKDHTLATANVVVPIKTAGVVLDGKTEINPATITLQVLRNSATNTDVTSVVTSNDWQDAASSDGTTQGLTTTWSDAVSESGKYTWFRVVAERDGYTVKGLPVQAACLDVTGSSIVVGAARIDSIAPGADGKSARVTLSGKDPDDDGYEVSWSPDIEAWESTEEPDAYETPNSSLIVKGLDEGVRYYMRARAYDLNSDGEPVYGEYGNMVDVVPVSTPTEVVLHGAASTARGSDLLLTWTYDTESPQQAWRLVATGGKVAYQGTGTACARAITAREYGSASTLTYHVEMTTGGGWAKSADATFRIADPPTCELTLGTTLVAQPLRFQVASDTGDFVNVVVSAQGSSGSGLYGDTRQFANDTVYSGTLAPAWTTSGGSRHAQVELPTGLVFWDGADYTVTVTVTDRETGLVSEADSDEFTVAWSHQAMQPNVTVTADQAALSATITVTAPSNLALGDVFDLYRLTMDGERRIAAAQPFGSTIVDRFAPFTRDGSELAYMAATRTADGDVCIGDDVPYTLANRSLRLDWGTDSVELPYNIAASDEFEKDSETRKHLDGMRRSYWNEGVSRTATLSTDLIRFRDTEQEELVRDALQHTGGVFVRTPDGLAFEADLRAGTIEREPDSGATAVSLKANEHDLTQDGTPGDADMTHPTWTGGTLVELNGTVFDQAGKFPLVEWQFVGYSGSTLYVVDASGKVRNGGGGVKTGWTYDGETLYDANGDEVEVTEEAS